jgi:uncharacterized protein
MKLFFSAIIYFYKAVITPIRRQLLGQFLMCRYPVSCSDYTLAAIAQYGAFTGLAMGLRRLAHCHPFTKPYAIS